MPLASRTFGDLITFTRGSTGSYFDAAGVLQSAAINASRFDYDPATLLPRGFLLEEARTNSLRNNTMVGAVAGTPGTSPTNWFTQVITTTGLTQSIVGTGTEDGITYIDLRIQGTASGNGTWQVLFETASGIAATNAQTWAASLYTRIVAGSLTGIGNPQVFLSMYNSSSVFLSSLATTVAAPTTAALKAQRVAAAHTLNNAATAFIVPGYQAPITSGAVIDLTLRIGMPQTEQGSFATSVIPTSTVAVSRNADVAGVNTLSPWFNAITSTLFAEFDGPATRNPAPARNTVVEVSDATTDNNMRVFIFVADNAPASANSAFAATNAGRLSAGGTYTGAITRAAAAFANADRALTVNGSSAVTSVVGVFPISVTRMSLGSDGLFGNALNGHLLRVAYYPVRLTNADLQAITV